jgi:2-methylisocitrate lyase-like PEP mutase family enzyme
MGENMANADQETKVQRFRALHTGPTLVLPNAWDAGSAVLMAQAGAQAIATTSGGVAWSLGRGDGQQLGRSEMIHVVRRIAAAVDVPVSADVEGGYGSDPAAVGLTVEAVVEAGAVGVNLEDSGAAGGGLFGVGEQAARLAAARAAAVSSGLAGLVINARTDVYLFQIGAEAERFDHVLSRAAAYAEAGADCIFVPGLTDLAVLEKLVAQSALPVSVMAGPGAPSVAEFSAAGVQRVSVGTAVTQAAYSLVQTATAELLQKGTYGALAGGLDFGSINGLFASGH